MDGGGVDNEEPRKEDEARVLLRRADRINGDCPERQLRQKHKVWITKERRMGCGARKASHGWDGARWRRPAGSSRTSTA